MMKPNYWILDIQLSDSSEISYHTGQVASYSCELEYNLANKIKSQISNVQYGNLLLRFCRSKVQTYGFEHIPPNHNRTTISLYMTQWGFSLFYAIFTTACFGYFKIEELV